MTTRYFRLTEDVYAQGRWYLGDPVDEKSTGVEDPWMFSAGRPIQAPGSLQVPIDEPGRPLDYSEAGVGSTPILHVKLATVFAELAPDDVQLFTVAIPGHPEQFNMLVATRLIRCIDDEASREVEYWDPIKHKQPEKAGQYYSVAGMRIDASKVGHARVFRTWGWKIALIVSEDIKTALERTGATGMYFTEV
ncbi:hypothetical protein COCOR_01599 [Corallococcus coralloides DSM 2259]|uniref:Immunity MXAN-0049 protein domain-containing protein n=1 Tax=Corallococcus coralloides (strain ATCC 25202 / DSM 2259 / NBRC 100086 / M2) TaxID=1144275 RepID=H8MYF5_CORCM|nr:DUF1629 domain-containing protein [Corallococcus coralloides]AFE04163.1 hypothetical protein COCOR_01599 [Corallococcus coralloides DSM 2259]